MGTASGSLEADHLMKATYHRDLLITRGLTETAYDQQKTMPFPITGGYQ
jgi:hypothetical protein